jgi:penicillin G amidase
MHKSSLLVRIAALLTVLLMFPAPVFAQDNGLYLPLITGSSDENAATPESSATPYEKASILRDEYGVPHIYAATEAALWYANGYAQGQDRLWQADVLRRTATGTSAEFFGSSAVEGDLFARTLFGSQAERTAIVAAAPVQTRQVLDSFAAGMNDWINEATQTGQLPPEYAAFGVTPRPWTTDDSFAILMLFLRRFGQQGADELTNATYFQELVARFGVEEGGKVFLDTHWLNDPDAPTTVPAAGQIGPVRRGKAPQATLPADLDEAAQQLEKAEEGWQRNLQRAGVKEGSGSNAVVLAPGLSADGRALLLGGPQMGYTTPQINHEMGLHQGNFDITGMQIAGVPSILIGVTRNTAWTITVGGSDTADIYMEILNPDNPSQYFFQGEWRGLECRTETIVVRGDLPQSLPVCASVHGPVVGAIPGAAFTLKSALHGAEVESFEALHSVMRARTLAEFDTALSHLAPNINVLYADVRGNIAYWHVGKIPVRSANDDLWMPHDGSGGAEWQGFVPWEQMPHSVNPSQGWLASWNNKPALQWDSSSIGFWNWGPAHRYNTLKQLVEAVQPGTATVATLEAIIRTVGVTTDTPSGSESPVLVSKLLQPMLAHVNSTNPRLLSAVALLAAWDGRQIDNDSSGHYDSPAVAIFNTWWSTFVTRVFADDLGTPLQPDVQPDVAGNLAYRLITDAPALPLLHAYLGAETVDDALTHALEEALDALTLEYGSPDPNAWLQPVAEIVWTPIGAGSVPNTIWMNRGTYNQIVHLGPGSHLFAQNVVAPGQSGNPSSPHFADQLGLYTTWTYKPMRLTRADLNGHIESTTVLKP